MKPQFPQKHESQNAQNHYGHGGGDDLDSALWILPVDVSSFDLKSIQVEGLTI